MKPLMVRGLLLLATLLAAAPPAYAADGAQNAQDTVPRVIESPRPRYPAEAFYLGITGTTVLVMDVGVEGVVEQVFVEQSSRNRLLDKAAIEAARLWRFSPALVNGLPERGRVRVPVSFTLDALAAEDDAIRERAFALPPRLQMPASGADADAGDTVAGYIEDPIPLEAGSVADAVALLKARGSQRNATGLSPGVAIYTLDGENDRTRWLVYEDGHHYAPSLVRKRLTHDGRHAYLVTRMLCEAQAADACAHLAGTVQRPYRQRAVPLETTPEGVP